MARKPKTEGADTAPSSEKVAQDTSAPADTSAPTETTELATEVADAATTEAPAPAGEGDSPADLDAINTEMAIEAAPTAADEIVSAGGVDTAATVENSGEGDQGDQGDLNNLDDEDAADIQVADGFDELVYPLEVRVTNQTRMPIQIPSAKLMLGPAPDSQDVMVRGAGELRSLLSELGTLRDLNGFGEDAFHVGPADAEGDE